MFKGKTKSKKKSVVYVLQGSCILIALFTLYTISTLTYRYIKCPECHQALKACEQAFIQSDMNGDHIAYKDYKTEYYSVSYHKTTKEPVYVYLQMYHPYAGLRRIDCYVKKIDGKYYGTLNPITKQE